MILRKIIVNMLKINTFNGQQSLIILYLLFLAVNGSWSGWSDWSLCSVTCGSGVITRTRDCTHPSPLFGGQNCSGEDTETQPCNRTTCPCESVGAGLMLTLNYFKFHIQTKLHVYIKIFAKYSIYTQNLDWTKLSFIYAIQ